jgi:hypothetical protein
LLDEDMFLRGEEPKQIAAADLVFTIRQQIKSAPLRDKVKLQLGVMVHRVGATVVAVMPEMAVECGGQFQLLAHGGLGRSAGWQPAVSPTGSRQREGCRLVCGLPIRDTADCQSALRDKK